MARLVGVRSTLDTVALRIGFRLLQEQQQQQPPPPNSVWWEYKKKFANRMLVHCILVSHVALAHQPRVLGAELARTLFRDRGKWNQTVSLSIADEDQTNVSADASRASRATA